MTDIIWRLLDEAEKAQRKGHLLLAEVCRDASDQLGLVMDERDRLREALRAALLSHDIVKAEHPSPNRPVWVEVARAALGEDRA